MEDEGWCTGCLRNEESERTEWRDVLDGSLNLCKTLWSLVPNIGPKGMRTVSGQKQTKRNDCVMRYCV